MHKLKTILETSVYQSSNIHITVLGLLISLLVIVFTFILTKFIKKLFIKLEKQKKLDTGASNSIYQISKYLIWVIAIVTSLQAVGVNFSIFITSVAALLVGVGLGLQQLFNDIASGFILLFEQNLKKEDVIELENGTLGTVISIGIRTSQIKTFSNVIIVVPNSKFVNDSIINWSHIDSKSRYEVNIGVSYDSDPSIVRNLLLKAAQNENIQKNPETFVRFSDFGESSLIFTLFFWCSDSGLAKDIESDIRFEISHLFKENNIVIPFPQRDIHIKTGSLPPTSQHIS